MSLFFPGFFKHNMYFIDEKVQLLKFENAYTIYDELGLPIGAVSQKLNTKGKLLRLLFKKSMLPFTLELSDANGKLLATIQRNWTFFLSKITILDANGNVSGFIQQKFSFIKPRFIIYDAMDQVIAEINGDWKAWSFLITENPGATIGTISKKWAGAAREIFTSADKYVVAIEPGYAEDRARINIVVTAITIDMVLKESK